MDQAKTGELGPWEKNESKQQWDRTYIKTSMNNRYVVEIQCLTKPHADIIKWRNQLVIGVPSNWLVILHLETNFNFWQEWVVWTCQCLCLSRTISPFYVSLSKNTPPTQSSSTYRSGGLPWHPFFWKSHKIAEIPFTCHKLLQSLQALKVAILKLPESMRGTGFLETPNMWTSASNLLHWNSTKIRWKVWETMAQWQLNDQNLSLIESTFQTASIPIGPVSNRLAVWDIYHG